MLHGTYLYGSLDAPNTDITSLVSALKLRQLPAKTQFSNVLVCHLALL